jgi:hypothetical protein
MARRRSAARPCSAGPGKRATCHVPPLFTEPGWNMHTAEEMGIDDFQANRSPDKRYRTTPLKGLFAHQKGGFFHDGRSRRSATWSATTTGTCLRPYRGAIAGSRRVSQVALTPGAQEADDEATRERR